MTTIRIFISSPGDVGDERTRAQKVVEELAGDFPTLTLETLLWEQEPLLASDDFQSQIRTPADFDLFVTIIGSRLGSPLGDHFTRDDGTPYASGTEFEFEIALKAYRAKGAPELLVYRKAFDAPTRAQLGQSDNAQFDAVDGFFDKWFKDQSSNTATGAYHTFDEAEQFEAVFKLHLKKLLKRFLPKPNNIPKPISNFVGRDALIADVKTKLFDGATRLVSLLGPGGTGKTRLAIRIAQDVLPEFDDGAFLVQLASIRQGDMIPAAIATSLDIKQGEHGNMLDAVIESLKSRNVLLVIDNLEQVENAARQINELLGQCDRVKMIATSRSDLRLTGARNVRVNPFTVPAPGRNSLRDARSSDAVALFVDRAKSVQDGFELTEDNAAQVIEICRKLDGLPLAIELATSRMRSMNIDRLYKAMEKRFAVLKGGSDELLDHQKSLKELVTWSYELLTEEEQMLWRRVAIFPGGCFMDDAEIVCDPEDDFIVDIEIEGLVDKSLAMIELSDPPRVNMLQTLREFALQQLQEVGEFEFHRDRFVDWVQDLADRSHDELLKADDQDIIAILDYEYPNILGAIEYCNEQEQPERVVRIVSGVWRHWFERGRLQSERDLMAPAADEKLELEPQIRARALKALGSISRFQKDADSAQAFCEQALAIYTELEDEDGRARAIGELGAISISQSEFTRAATQLDEALSIRTEKVHDPAHESFLLATRGVVHHLQTDLENAKALYEKALAVGSELGDTDAMASALVNLGEIAEADGDFDEAYARYRESLNLFHARGKKVAIAYCTELLAGLSVKQGRADQGAMLFGFAEQLRVDIAAPIEPYNESRLNADLDATRAALTEEGFQTSWKTGAGLYVDEFLDYMDEPNTAA